MNLTVVHLSDIHLKASGNAVVKRAESLARALDASMPANSDCLLAVTGDIAYSGKAEQYVAARRFLDEMCLTLMDLRKGSSIFQVCVPGNHDCMIPEDTALRDLAIQKLLQTSPDEIALSPSYSRECVSAQKDFFSFVDDWVRPPTSAPRPSDLFWSESFLVGKHTVLVHCYNTAWMSKVNERPSELLAPVWEADNAAEADLVIALAHHPLGWLAPHNAREFGKRLDDSVDVVLTGHEHESAIFRKSSFALPSEDAAEVMFMEGGVLQQWGNADLSRFQTLTINLDDQQMQLRSFRWDRDSYIIESDNDPNWLPLNQNKRRGHKRLVPTQEFIALLNDPGMVLRHPRKPALTLSDTYVYPSVEVMDMIGANRLGSIDTLSEGALRKFIRANKRVLITGTKWSGKTALSKMLVLEGFDRSQVPIWIRGTTLKSASVDNLKRLIEQETKWQYGIEAASRFWQMDKPQRVLVVDDFDHALLNKDEREAILESIDNLFGEYILFSHDSYPTSELLGSGDKSHILSLRRCQIRPFGHVCRARLIEKWMRLGIETGFDEAEIASEVNQKEGLISLLLGRNLLPHCPMFVLSLLRISDTEKPDSARSGSYGYHYESLIKMSLTLAHSELGPDISIEAIDVFLSLLAFRMLRLKQAFLEASEFEEIACEYRDMYSMPLDQKRILAILDRAAIMRQDTMGRYVFFYSSSYYYYAAQYIASNLHDSKMDRDVRGVLDYLASMLHVEEYANILTFVVYFTRDDKTISRIIEYAASLYKDRKPTDLAKDTEFLSRLRPRVTIVLPGTDTRENTTRRQQEKDAEEEHIEQSRSRDPELFINEKRKNLDDAVLMEQSYTTIQLLGQILCNFPGVLLRETKLAIARECYELGLRMLGALYDAFGANLDTFRYVSRQILREESGIKNEDRLIRLADQWVYWLVLMHTISAIKHISQSAGSHHLEQTYEEIARSDNNIPIKLINFSVKLDHFKTFPHRDLTDLLAATNTSSFAFEVLRILGLEHLALYKTPRSLKLELSNSLKIKITPQMLAASE